jgi:translation elongation factor P/translation initiation factor 5A
MATTTYYELRRGMVIVEDDDRIYVVIDWELRPPTTIEQMVRLTLGDLVTGQQRIVGRRSQQWVEWIEWL